VVAVFRRDRAMSRSVEEANRRLLRARDAMERAYAQALRRLTGGR
jgi:hypothetical protein